MEEEMCSRIKDMNVTERGVRAQSAIAKCEAKLQEIAERDDQLFSVVESFVRQLMKRTDNASAGFRDESGKQI